MPSPTKEASVLTRRPKVSVPPSVEEHGRAPSSRSKKRLDIGLSYPAATLRWYVMAVAAVLTFAWAANSITSLPPASRMTRPDGLLHIVGGGIAVLAGPFQLLGSVRARSPAVHRWLGRVYAAAVLVGGLSGLSVSWDRAAFPLARWGFCSLDVAWLVTLAFGVYYIWNGDVARHRGWIIRNFALTYAAVMLRWQLPVLVKVLEVAPRQAINIVPWSCWVPNLIFAEVYLRSRGSAQLPTWN